MELNNLKKTSKRNKKRVGRGYGSGKGGHTAGRGSKGTKARSKVPLAFTGTKVKKSLLKRLPLQRGKGKLKGKKKPLVINLTYLNLFKKDSEVNLESLAKLGIIKEKEAQEAGLKILGDGKLEVALKVNLPCSKGAKKKIEKAGGKVLGGEGKEGKKKKINKETK